MVIQLIPNSYTRIPDEEDVTPIDNPSVGLLKRKKYLVLCLVGLAVGIVLGTYFYYALAFHQAVALPDHPDLDQGSG